MLLIDSNEMIEGHGDEAGGAAMGSRLGPPRVETLKKKIVKLRKENDRVPEEEAWRALKSELGRHMMKTASPFVHTSHTMSVRLRKLYSGLIYFPKYFAKYFRFPVTSNLAVHV
jgi:hypothetical protein